MNSTIERVTQTYHTVIAAKVLMMRIVKLRLMVRAISPPLPISVQTHFGKHESAVGPGGLSRMVLTVLCAHPERAYVRVGMAYTACDEACMIRRMMHAINTGRKHGTFGCNGGPV